MKKITKKQKRFNYIAEKGIFKTDWFHFISWDLAATQIVILTKKYFNMRNLINKIKKSSDSSDFVFNCIAFGFILGIFITNLFIFITHARDDSIAYYNEFKDRPAPNPVIFNAALSEVKSKIKGYSKENLSDFIILDKEKGIIETDWFHFMKPEADFKFQVNVWGNYYRVDVWEQRNFYGMNKTNYSVSFERYLQQDIQNNINKNAILKQ